MHKKFIVVFILVIAVYCIIAISQSQAKSQSQTKNIECAKGYTKIRYNRCYNPETHLRYDTGGAGEYFFLFNVGCGSDCNLDGTNCKKGNCSEKEIRAHGYTQIKENKQADNDYRRYTFYNPKTHLAYFYYFNGVNEFYLNGIPCGESCDIDGKNCKSGNCNEKEIKDNGYTEIKSGKFYNPNTKLSFSSKDFYIDEKWCGKDCNIDGTNCKSGVCNVKECENGYTEIKDNMCYNPKINLSYKPGKGSLSSLFYINDKYCGSDCNPDGTNCRMGSCNIKECQKGYTEIKGEKCYNPQTHLSHNSYKNFYLNDHYYPCGHECNTDGTGCQEGVCNVADCKQGYKNLSYVLIETTYDKIFDGLMLYNLISGDRGIIEGFMCYNNSKTEGYFVFKPEEKINLRLKFVKYYK